MKPFMFLSLCNLKLPFYLYVCILLYSRKTVTWADDPESNYKNQVTANMYEAQSMANNSTDQYYENQSDTQQQQQQPDYLTTDTNGIAAGANESPHYQYDDSNQYDDGQYQYQAQSDAVGTDDGYYYSTEQMNQYDEAPPVAQPQQQEVSSSSIASILSA